MVCGVADHKLCSNGPTGVRTFASFVIDISKVQLKDIGADDNGTRSTSRSYKVEVIGDHVIAATPIQDKTLEDDCYTLCRQYAVHKGTPVFRLIIAYAIDNSGCTIPRALLHYFFKSGKVSPINVPAHGNSLSNRPFFCTQPSTITEIQERCNLKSVSKVYNDIFESAGGLEESMSISMEPRNKMFTMHVSIK